MHTSPVEHVPSAHRTLYKLINRQTDRCDWFTTCIHQNTEIDVPVIGMACAICGVSLPMRSTNEIQIHLYQTINQTGCNIELVTPSDD